MAVQSAESTVSLKQKQFNAAMDLYSSRRIYGVVAKLVAVGNVSLQAYLLVEVVHLKVGWEWHLAAFFAALVLADLINGAIHMVMDNNDSYDSVAGPLIAAFHLHHKTPMYKVRPLPVVYFNESGAKIWLLPYLVAVALALRFVEMHPVFSHILIYFGILSSVAEVAHYLCHTSMSKPVLVLGKMRLLLPKRHHGRHHGEDNVNYAFLNGWTDPLLNVIARKTFAGYKKNTDLHYATYEGPGTANR